MKAHTASVIKGTWFLAISRGYNFDDAIDLVESMVGISNLDPATLTEALSSSELPATLTYYTDTKDIK